MRRNEFNGVPSLVEDECERLGLFTTRLPQFSQLFFYNFHDSEIYANTGQLCPASDSRRAAEAYIRSGTRLESTCGISEVWYLYVEKNLSLFENHTEPLPHLEPAPPDPRRPLGSEKAQVMFNTFPWFKHHSRPWPQKKIPISGPPLHSEGDSQHYEDDPIHDEDVPMHDEDDPIHDEDSSQPSKDSSQRGEEEGSGKQWVDSTAGKQVSDYDAFWPTDPAFTEALFKMEDPIPTVPVAPLIVTDGFVSSSIPEEHELQIQTQTPLSSPAHRHRRAETAIHITPRDVRCIRGHTTYGGSSRTRSMDMRGPRDVVAESGSNNGWEEEDQVEDDEATESTSHQVTSKSDEEEGMDDVDYTSDSEETPHAHLFGADMVLQAPLFRSMSRQKLKNRGLCSSSGRDARQSTAESELMGLFVLVFFSTLLPCRVIGTCVQNENPELGTAAAHSVISCISAYSISKHRTCSFLSLSTGSLSIVSKPFCPPPIASCFEKPFESIPPLHPAAGWVTSDHECM